MNDDRQLFSVFMQLVRPLTVTNLFPHLLMLCIKTENEIFKISYTGNGPKTEIYVNLGDSFMIERKILELEGKNTRYFIVFV